ncbi:MAG: DUF4870 domain-containing protein [Tepidisphaeraceae bacterium]
MSTPSSDPMAAFTNAPGYSGPPATEADKSEATVIYILAALTAWLGPLILLLVKKDASPFVKDQIKETLNWGITLTLAYVAIAILTVIIAFVIAKLAILGTLAMFALIVLNIVLSLVKGMPTMKQGIPYRYPFALRLVK